MMQSVCSLLAAHYEDSSIMIIPLLYALVMAPTASGSLIYDMCFQTPSFVFIRLLIICLVQLTDKTVSFRGRRQPYKEPRAGVKGVF
jgi:hypothetical protein